MQQLSLFDAQTARDLALANIAKSSGAGWQAAALACVTAHAATTTEPFLAEDVRLANPQLPEPKDNRAWGPVLTRAAKEGVIEKVGYAPAKTGHCRPMPLWKGILA